VLTPYYLETTDPHGGWPIGLSLIVGDSINDRLMFWNGHHCYRGVGQITTLRVSTERASDLTFLMRLKSIISERGVSDFQGRNKFIVLRSCSVETSRLGEIAEALRKGTYLNVQVVKDQDHATCVPNFASPDLVRYSNNLGFQELESREVTEIRDERVYVPAAVPWHIREARPPAHLRLGNWMVDLRIDRLHDHCRYANQWHIWLLPHRLRIDRAFELERQGSRVQGYDLGAIRVLREGEIAVAYSADERAVCITVPDDLDAFRAALCSDAEWLPFERFRENAPHGRRRYRFAELSDKGRYQLGVIERFGSLPETFDVLMNGYWREELLR